MQTIQLPRRRFRDADLVDFAIVGVGSAGGVLLQRLARAGFSVIGFEAGPFWDTERDWVSDEKRALTSSIGMSCASPAASIRWRSAQTTADAELAVVLCTGPPLRRAFIHPTSRSTRAMAWARTGRLLTRTSNLTMSCWSRRSRSPVQRGFPGAGHMVTLTDRIRWAASATR